MYTGKLRLYISGRKLHGQPARDSGHHPHGSSRPQTAEAPIVWQAPCGRVLTDPAALPQTSKNVELLVVSLVTVANGSAPGSGLICQQARILPDDFESSEHVSLVLLRTRIGTSSNSSNHAGFTQPEECVSRACLLPTRFGRSEHLVHGSLPRFPRRDPRISLHQFGRHHRRSPVLPHSRPRPF